MRDQTSARRAVKNDSRSRYAWGVVFLSAALLSFMTGCRTYQPILKSLPASQLRTLRCLEVGVERYEEEDFGISERLVKVRFGNPCYEATRIDLSKVRVRFFSDGAPDSPISLSLYNPLGVIRPGTLGVFSSGEEVLRFDSPSEGHTLDLDLSGLLCVDVSEIIDPPADVDAICYRSGAKKNIDVWDGLASGPQRIEQW